MAIQLWAYSFGTSNSEFIFINKDGDNAKANLQRLKNQMELLPEYMKFEYYIDEDGKKVKHSMNATYMKHPVTKNSIRIKSKATSYETALSLARGLTAPILHFDEPEFTSHIDTIISNSYSTYETAAKNSKINGGMYGRIFTCTPGDLDTAAGMAAQTVLDNTQVWTEKCYDWTNEQVLEYIESKGDKCNHILYIEYQYYQIGLSQKWLKETAAGIGDPLVVRREILLQRLHGSSLSPYPQEDIEYIVETEHKPIDELWIREYFKFDLYEKLDRRVPYLVGVDCSTGTVGDNNAITVINPYTLRPAAEFECNYVGETIYEQIITELVVQHIPKACVCLERNSIGDGIIDFFLNTNSPIMNNLYFDRDKNLLEEKLREAQDMTSILQTQARVKSYYGVYTLGQSRDSMFAILSRRVSENKDDFISHNVIRDLSRLVRKPNGKIEAGGTSIK